MNYIVKCRECGKQIVCGNGMYSALGQHLINNHPGSDTAHFDKLGYGIKVCSCNDDIDTKDQANGEDNSSARESCTNLNPDGRMDEESSLCCCQDQDDVSRRSARKSSRRLNSDDEDQNEKSEGYLHKTTVEIWRPSSEEKSCPSCGATDKPLIRIRKSKATSNPIGAYLLFGCWPVCFMPLLTSRDNEKIFCCKKCGYCIGRYDKKLAKIVDMEEDVKCALPEDMI